MDNAMIPSLLLVLSILLVGVLALLVLLIIRARQSGLLTSASGVRRPNAENAEKAPGIDFQTGFLECLTSIPRRKLSIEILLSSE